MPEAALALALAFAFFWALVSGGLPVKALARSTPGVFAERNISSLTFAFWLLRSLSSTLCSKYSKLYLSSVVASLSNSSTAVLNEGTLRRVSR